MSESDIPLGDVVPVGATLPAPCIECGRRMILKTGRYGLFYGCIGFPECGGVLGAHAGNGKPMGVQADAETRKARIAAHNAFDPLWRGGRMSRSTAYHWLASRLMIAYADCHIGNFGRVTCEKVVAVCGDFDPKQVPGFDAPGSRKARKKKHKKNRKAANRGGDSRRHIEAGAAWGVTRRTFRSVPDNEQEQT